LALGEIPKAAGRQGWSEAQGQADVSTTQPRRAGEIPGERQSTRFLVREADTLEYMTFLENCKGLLNA
jgi:hypothetical protein